MSRLRSPLLSALAVLMFALALTLSPAQSPARAQTQDPAPLEQPLPQPPAQPALSFAYDAPLSLWLEGGGLYRTLEGSLSPYLRVAVRGFKPLSETVSLYGALGLDGGLGVTLDAGAWYSFLPDADDLFGFRAYGGAGLAYAAGSVGIALSAAASYELSTRTSLVLVYTHRPLFLPALGQAFDVSLGVSFTLPR